jgi:hypothetical protein
MQHIKGSGNVQVGRDFRHQQVHHVSQRSGRGKLILRLQWLTIYLLIVSVILAIVNAFENHKLNAELDAVLQIKNSTLCVTNGLQDINKECKSDTNRYERISN